MAQWAEEQRIIEKMKIVIETAEKNTMPELEKALTDSREIIADAMAIRTRICQMMKELRGKTRPASYHLVCKDCGAEVGCDKKRFEKWQLRVKNIKTYLCRACRRTHPQQMQVAIPDGAYKDYKETRKTAKEADGDIIKTVVQNVLEMQVMVKDNF